MPNSLLEEIIQKEPRVKTQILDVLANPEKIPDDALANPQSFYNHFKGIALKLVGWVSGNEALADSRYYSTVIDEIMIFCKKYEKEGLIRHE